MVAAHLKKALWAMQRPKARRTSTIHKAQVSMATTAVSKVPKVPTPPMATVPQANPDSAAKTSAIAERNGAN